MLITKICFKKICFKFYPFDLHTDSRFLYFIYIIYLIYSLYKFCNSIKDIKSCIIDLLWTQLRCFYYQYLLNKQYNRFLHL